MSDNRHERDDCIKVSETASLGECENTSVENQIVYPDNPNPVIKVPVELGEFDVTTNLSAKIHFDDPVQEIKKVKHTVEIVQCSLMTNTVMGGDDASPYVSGEFPLFLKGFVRKNIQYETPVPGTDRDCVNSDVKSKTVRVPFTCTTMVDVTNVLRPLTNSNEEFGFFRAQDLGKGFPEKDKFLSSDLSQFHFMESQYYNEFPFCELVSSNVIAWDEATDRVTTGDSPVKEGYFHNVVEKMMLRFRIKVLQKQQVRVDSLG
ncbi:CsxC family protein [Pontibacillus sp. HMF3514]|uniref:CsxC family protein n=1 Tax=Pontibacillus sp. HMF3514 TaxID=2692425 RepID=UPI00131FD0B9|nr:DUF3794 domain-containing protein [Pontibacillus sp. HMF3514]QHE52623.1 DUF3794 domain-containing protein [Pontibacillus sp. HMF3514]